jgi:pentatricopeptide repeat-containing protein PET309
MLERTSACLDTGVRFSLRQKSLFPKSRRLLHSSFWSTHAPDVDHLCLSHKTTSYAPASSCAAPSAQNSSSVAPASGTDSYDAPFLDFLYPAPTQAFMTRLSQWERWSRKTTRPNVLRGYSSLTTPRDPSSPPSSSSRAHHELAVLLESPIPDNAFLSLDIERAWNLLSQISHPGPDLLCRAIHWFVERHDKSADQHAVDLYADLPSEFQSPAVYRDVIISNLRLGRLPVAVTLHKEASALSRAGSIASDHMMAAAIEHSDWPLAVSVLKEWEVYNSWTPSSLESREFWSLSMKDSRFAHDKLHYLDRMCCQTMKEDPSGELTKDLQVLYTLMATRWISTQSRQQVFLRPGNVADSVRGCVRRLVEKTHENGLASVDFFENVLIALTTLDRCATSHNCSAIVTATYLLYRRSGFFTPTEKLLSLMTKFWRDHNLAFAGQGPSRSFIGKEMLLEDWTQHHQKPDDHALVAIMDTFAQRGLVEGVQEHADLYKSLHPEGDLDPNSLWPLLTVHAVNRKPSLALKQLHRMKTEYGVTPNLRCWNIVLHAYTRVDDLEGARDTFRQLLKSGFQPDEYSFTALLTLYAKRGDTDGVIDFLDFARSSSATKPTTYMLNCMIVALTRNSDMDGAMKALDQTVQAVQENRAEGSLTLCYNSVLTACAWQRDLKATMKIYRRMQKQNVPLDERSYGALMLVLCLYRQSPSAHKILKSIMPASGVRPMAFHYAILTRGYLGQELYSEAVKVEGEMEKAQVRQTASSRAVASRANTLYQHSITSDQTDEAGQSLPLDLAIEDFQKVLNDSRVFRHGMQPEPTGYEAMDISYLFYIHGKRRSFEAVQHLFQTFQKNLAELDKGHDQAPIILLLTNLMFVQSQAQEWSEVDKYWDLIKSRVDEIRLSHIPASKFMKSVQHDQTTMAPREGESALIPSSYKFMLSQPLQYYIRSQFAQSSIRKLVPMMLKLLSQGFRFANKTWNELIVRLCQTSPPRALLAYTLVENYMMKDWPGWIPQRHGSIAKPETVFIRKQTFKEGLQYINTRYISREQIIPQYRTMVYLARAMLDVRGLASRGLGDDHNESGEGLRELRKQVGTIPEIRDQAPKTLHAVQSMPRVLDRLQGSLLRAQ